MADPAGRPYLSVVATARNDNHGGDLLARMQTFLNALAAQAQRHRVRTELVLVEWNPPLDRPRLIDDLSWPDSEWFATRIVTVPTELHAKLEHADRLPLFQMIAKNVGIRRARGDFVLATNVDVIFSDELMKAVASGHLDRGQLYRADRHDVDIRPAPETDIADLLTECRDNVVRVCSRAGSHDLRADVFYPILTSDNLPLWARFAQHLWWAFMARLRRASTAAVSFTKSVNKRDTQAPFSPPHANRTPALARRTATGAISAQRGFLRDSVATIRNLHEYERVRLALHTNASGDFTLLAREAWLDIGGYAELELFSMHIDGLFLYQAHYAGYAEGLLPGPLYHIEHTHGFKPNPDEVESLNTRLEHAAIPQITSQQFMSWIREMFRTQRPIEFNRPAWGFADEELSESVPAGRGAKAAV